MDARKYRWIWLFVAAVTMIGVLTAHSDAQRVATVTELRKFYVTGGRLTEDGTPRNDSKVPALVCFGADRLDALTRCGVTVWTEEEYQEYLAGAAKKDR